MQNGTVKLTTGYGMKMTNMIQNGKDMAKRTLEIMFVNVCKALKKTL